MRSVVDTPISRDGRSIIIAMDHGLERGPIVFEDNPERADPSAVFDIATHDAVTGLAVHQGVAETYYPSYDDSVNLVAKLNGKTSMVMGDRYSPPIWSVESAAELGADAIGYTVYTGSNREADMFSEFAAAREDARDADLPVVLWSYPRGQGVNDHNAPDTVAYAARIGLELGADMAKIKYPGTREGVEWAVRVAGELPVLMSGGASVSEEAFLRDVATFMAGGGKGLTVGRNIWQRANPTATLDKLERLVFEDATVEDVL
ncbi:class I fructose-bisphosphate aldolase [Haladaptatus salinisoli]|uniref:class I fructose-bisphosphate aldolase n=1 Tax=Haladaptatus salinisoli TaxID=2884876 RepID=UPI001D0BC10C|nr:aldolase [Haladaptatus salinisoli]